MRNGIRDVVVQVQNQMLNHHASRVICVEVIIKKLKGNGL